MLAAMDGHGVHYCGLKLAASTFVLSILDVDLNATFHKHYDFTTSYVRFGNMSLFASYAVLIRRKKVKAAVHARFYFSFFVFISNYLR